MPNDVDPKEPDYLGDPRSGRFIIPEGIRPILKEFRIEVKIFSKRYSMKIIIEYNQPV